MSSNALGGIRRLPTALTILLTVESAARLASAADDRRKPAQTVPDALDDLPGRGHLPTRRRPSRSFARSRI